MTTLQTEGGGPTVPAKIFCGGLSDVTTNASLRTHFSPYGEIVDSVVLTEKTTGRSRGFGFITFASEESVDAVLSSPQIVDGKEIDCKRAVPRGVIQGNDADDSTDNNLNNNINNSNLNNTSINSNLSNNSVNNSNNNSNSGRSHTNNGSIGSNNTGSTGFNATKIFVGGLPQSCTDDKLREHFGKYGTIKNLSVMVDRDTNRHRGFGFVEYESPESVEEVMRHYYDHQIDNKWVECKKALPREIMAGNSNINTSGGGNGLGGSNTSGMGNPRSRTNPALAAPAANSNYADYYRNPYLPLHPAGVPSQQIYGRYGRHDPRYMYASYACAPSNIYTGGYGQIPPPIHGASGPGAQISPVISSIGSHAVNTHYSDVTSEQSNLQVSTGNSSNINSSGNNNNNTNVTSNANYENQGDYLSENQGVTDASVHSYHQSRTGAPPPQLAQPPHLYAPPNPIRPGPYTQGRYAPSGTLPYSIPGTVPTHGRIRGIY